MGKYFFSIACMVILLFHCETNYSQSSVDRYNTAKTQYENGNYTTAIQSLKSLEQSMGANPKVQSLLVYAYVANNDFVNAKIELNKYKRMVPNNSSQAHKDLLALESSIHKQLQQLEKNHTTNIEATRMKRADDAINSAYNTPERQKIIALQKENKNEKDKVMHTENNYTNPIVLFNLGVEATTSGNLVEAKKHYLKAIELKPDFKDAYRNLGIIILAEDGSLVKQMNNLGTSSAENKKYEELKTIRINMFKEALPYFETLFNLDSNNLEVANLLLNLYDNLNDTPRYNAIKQKIAILEEK